MFRTTASYAYHTDIDVESTACLLAGPKKASLPDSRNAQSLKTLATPFRAPSLLAACTGRKHRTQEYCNTRETFFKRQIQGDSRSACFAVSASPLSRACTHTIFNTAAGQEGKHTRTVAMEEKEHDLRRQPLECGQKLHPSYQSVSVNASLALMCMRVACAYVPSPEDQTPRLQR